MNNLQNQDDFYYLDEQQKLEENLTKILDDEDLSDSYISELSAIAERYELTFDELGAIYKLTNEILKRGIEEKDLTDRVVKDVEVREEEISEIIAILEDILNRIKTKSKK